MGIRLELRRATVFGRVRRVQFALAAAVSWFVPIWAGPAQAAGFALREYGLAGMGSAFAGSSAQSDDPGFLAYNPATSAGVTNWDAQFTLNAIYPSSEANFTVATTALGTNTGGSAAPEDFIKDAYEPGMSLRFRLTPDLTGGVAVSAPWGLSTRYNQGWAGRYYAIESKLVTVNVVPSLAYQVSDALTLSAGVQFQYAKGTLSNAIDFGTLGVVFGVPGSVAGAQDGFVELNASDWGFGYVLGALWTPDEAVSIGLSYRSAIDLKLSGDADFTLDSAGVGAALSGVSGAFVDTPARADLTTPAVATLGAALAISPQLSLLAEVGYTSWSDFAELRARFANPLQPDDFQRFDWKDTWLYAGGVRFKPNDEWTLRAGAGLDQSPTTDATRDPRIPDSDRTWVAFSARKALSETMDLELGYAHLFFPEEPINLSAAAPGNAARGNLVGRTDADADVITLQLTFR